MLLPGVWAKAASPTAQGVSVHSMHQSLKLDPKAVGDRGNAQSPKQGGVDHVRQWALTTARKHQVASFDP